MHEPVASPDYPKWCGAHQRRCVLPFVPGQNRYAVAGTNVVQQEVAKRMDSFVPESPGNKECAAVDSRALGRRNNCGNVTNRAAHLLETSLAVTDVGVTRATRGGRGRAHKQCECLNIFAIFVFRFRHGVIARAKSNKD